jgi:acyl-CoA synthetase (AMP-forming)/AMP-acid ligase II
MPPVALPGLPVGAAIDQPTAPALIDGPTGQLTSYRQLDGRVPRVAAGFAANQLRKGEVVAILAPNRPDWLVAAYGAMIAGGVVTGIHPLYTPGEVAAHLATRDDDAPRSSDARS